MTIRRAWLALGRQAVCLAIAGAFLVSAAVLDRSAGEESSEPPSLESIKASLDEIESGVDSEDVLPETLVRFRQTLNTATETLRARIDELEPRVHELEERVKQLGPAPAKDAPPESADIAGQREELTKQFAELDGELKQARVLSLRADQLSERVSQKRHSLYARELFARTPRVLDPFFWMDTLRAFPIELRNERAVFHAWMAERGDRLPWSAAVLITLAIIAVAIILSRWWFPRLLAFPTDTRSAKAWAALWVFVWFTARTPLATAGALFAFEALGLLTARVEQIADSGVSHNQMTGFRIVEVRDQPDPHMFRDCFHRLDSRRRRFGDFANPRHVRLAEILGERRHFLVLDSEPLERADKSLEAGHFECVAT